MLLPGFVEYAPELSVGQQRPRPEVPEPFLARPGILVVDDEPLVRDLLQCALERDGFRVWPAANGWQAKALYEQLSEDITIVLLDVRMPDLDGPQTLCALQQLNPKVCCCFMSGQAGIYETADLLQYGAVMVFAKPFDLDEVASQLRQLANGRTCYPDRTAHVGLQDYATASQAPVRDSGWSPAHEEYAWNDSGNG